VTLQRTRKLVRTKFRLNAAPSDQVDPSLIREMEKLSDNLDELDDRSLMQLRLATVAILCRIREEVQVRSALDL
jgi:hypothetical protein